jgi:hypothetical protein
MDNVIPFPIKNKIPAPADLDEVGEKIAQVKNHHINETLQAVVPILFSYLESAGFDFDVDDEEDVINDPNIKDAAFVVESIRSILCKYHNMDHPFQQISEHIFEPDLTNEGVFSLAKKINITFKSLEKGNS